MHGNVARGRVALELVQHAQAREIGQVDIEHDGVGLIVGRHGQAVGRRIGHVALEIHLACQLRQDVREAQVILDHEDAAPALTPLAQGVRCRRRGRCHGRRHGRRERRCGGRNVGRCEHGHGRRCQGLSQPLRLRLRCGSRGRGRAGLGRLQAHGHGQCENAALARRAGDGQRAAQQPRQITRYRQAQARAAELAVRAAIGLAEGIEDGAAAARQCRCRYRAPRKTACPGARRTPAGPPSPWP